MSPLLNNLAKIGLSLLFVVSISAVTNFFSPSDGTYYESRGDYKGAIDDISQALLEDRHKKKGYLYINRARNKRYLGDFSGAQKDLDKAKEIWQENRKVPIDGQKSFFTRNLFVEQCRLHIRLGKWDEALQDCKLALLDGDNSLIHSQLGAIHEAKNQLDAAETEHSKAVELASEEFSSNYGINFYASALLARAEFYKRQNRLESAFKDYDEAAEHASPCSDAFYGRGCMYLDKKDTQNALKDLDSAIKLSSRERDDYFAMRGLAYIDLKEYQKALVDFDKALSINSDCKDAAQGKTKCLELIK